MSKMFGQRGAAKPTLREVPKLEIPEHLRQGPREAVDLDQQMTRVAAEIREAKARGDQAASEARRPPPELPPTAANVFASNALELLRKREELLNAALMRADELEQLAQEMLACGTRVQEFLRHTQDITAAVVAAQPAMAIPAPAALAGEPQPGLGGEGESPDHSEESNVS